MAKVKVKRKVTDKTITLNKNNVRLFIMDYIEALWDEGITDRWVVSGFLQDFFTKDELRELGFWQYTVDVVYCKQCEETSYFKDVIWDEDNMCLICPICGSVNSVMDTYT